MVFPVVMYGCESWAVKKAEHQRVDAFELWCWRRLLRVPWTTRRFNQSIQKEISHWCSLEGLMLKLKLPYFGHLMRRADSFEKTLMLGKIEGRRRRGWQRMCWLLYRNFVILYSCIYSVQFSYSIMSDSLRPHDQSTPSLPVHHQLPNPCPLSQPYHPTISSSVVPFPSALNLSQHQGLFQWVSSLQEVDKVLEYQLQHQSFQWTARTGLL